MSSKSQWGHCPRVRRQDVSSSFFTLFLGGLDRPFDPFSVLTAEVDPTLYQSPSEFLRDYWAVESISKYPFELGINREEKAYHSFFESEDRCAAANAALCDALARPYPESIRGVIRRARSKCKWLLSGITRDEIVQRAGWGTGASTSLPRRRSSHQIKWEFATHVTSGALPYAVALMKYARVPSQKLEVVSGNKVTTVPKNAKTDRVIAIEPDWNMFFQLGLGRSIRRRLNRVGLLEATAQERNKALARYGSSSGKYATIDLKGASDSVSLALCELLLPSDLFRLLIDLRSPVGQVGDRVVHYEKVSSMGNGCTFELETALFWAISSSVADDAAVYGDDIIVPSESAPAVIDALRWFGFETNSKKTFIHGSFRESCGGHFFSGIDVTPPYFRKPLNSLPSFISGANAMRLRSMDRPFLLYDLQPAYDLLSSGVPRFLWGPPSVGDICLHKDRADCTVTWSSRYQSYSGKGLFNVRSLVEAPIMGAYTAALHGASETSLYPAPGEAYVIKKWYSDHWSYAPPSIAA